MICGRRSLLRWLRASAVVYFRLNSSSRAGAPLRAVGDRIPLEYSNGPRIRVNGKKAFRAALAACPKVLSDDNAILIATYRPDLPPSNIYDSCLAGALDPSLWPRLQRVVLSFDGAIRRDLISGLNDFAL